MPGVLSVPKSTLLGMTPMPKTVQHTARSKINHTLRIY